MDITNSSLLPFPFGVNTFGTISKALDGMIKNQPDKKDAQPFKSFGESISETADSIKKSISGILFKTPEKQAADNSAATNKTKPPKAPKLTDEEQKALNAKLFKMRLH